LLTYPGLIKANDFLFSLYIYDMGAFSRLIKELLA